MTKWRVYWTINVVDVRICIIVVYVFDFDIFIIIVDVLIVGVFYNIIVDFNWTFVCFSTFSTEKLISNFSLLLLSLFVMYIFESDSLDNMNLHLTLFRTFVVFSTVGIIVFLNNVFATSFKCVWSDLWLDGLLSIVFCCKDGRLVEKML